MTTASRALVWCPQCHGYAALPATVRRDPLGRTVLATSHRHHRYLAAYAERFGRTPTRTTERAP